MEENLDWEEASESTRMEGGSRDVSACDLTEDDTQAIVESFDSPSDTIPAGNAAGRPHKQKRDSLLDGRDEKRSKNIHSGGGSGPIVAFEVHQFQRSGEVSQMPSSSRHPTEPHHCGGRQDVQDLSSVQHDELKHKIFISHSGAQKDFAEQLCVDLERRGFLCPFFDQREHSLPKGKNFVPLIKEAAGHCQVAVMVLSEEFLCSKWPMIELAEFHRAQQAGNSRLNMLPLFYKLSVKDLDEQAIEERWMPKWRQIADGDARIDVAKWSGAVRALRKANGLVFGQRGVSEVAYRKEIVQSIFKLSPPDLLFGSSEKMVGYSRFCEIVRHRFVRSPSGGPSYLGLYGTRGAGKTTLCKALCDEFYGEYTGRVCHVEVGKGGGMDLVEGRKPWDVDVNARSRLRRVKRMLNILCDLDKEVLDRIKDVDQGLKILRSHLKRKPVFLAIDNVTNENSSLKEAREYVEAGFHHESRIVITSWSVQNIRNLLDIKFCVVMPSLTASEAGELFLKNAAPSKSIFQLTVKEQRFLERCIRGCLYHEPGQSRLPVTCTPEDVVGLVPKLHAYDLWEMSFHPMALIALGDFFNRYFNNNDMLEWTGYFKDNEDPFWNLWKVPDGIKGIFWLQFHSLPSKEQLLFLDIAFFFSNIAHIFSDNIFAWRDELLPLLCEVHRETVSKMRIRLQDLERSGMITLTQFDKFVLVIGMHDLYKKFAYWYMKNHELEGLKNVCCVTKLRAFTPSGDIVASDPVRLRLVGDKSLSSAKMLAISRMQVVQKLEVLCICFCSNLRELNLEGLVSLRFLMLMDMKNLESVTLSGSHGLAKSGGIYDTLECVELSNLESLVQGPDVTWCTSLKKYRLAYCPRMMNMDQMECPHLEELKLLWLVGHQLATLPNMRALDSLGYLRVESKCDVLLDDVEASRGVRLRALGEPYLRVLEEVIMYLRTEWVVPTRVEIDENYFDEKKLFSITWINASKSWGEYCSLKEISGKEYRCGDLEEL